MKPSVSAWAVYILQCADGSLYTGCTNDLEARVARHNAGKGAAYTRSRRPVRLVFHERADDRGGALRREHALKQLSRAEKLGMLAKRRPRPGAGRPGRKSPNPKRK